MDNNSNDVGHGHTSLVIAFITGTFAWIDGHTFSEAVKSIAAFVSMGAGCMAIRYYYYATKKQK